MLLDYGDNSLRAGIADQCFNIKYEVRRYYFDPNDGNG